MVNYGIKVVLLLLLVVAVPFSHIERHQSWAFESRQLSLPKSKRVLSFLQSKRRSSTDHDCNDPNNDVQDVIISKPTTKRRKILLSSAAAFLTTILSSSGKPKVAEGASSLTGLEDTEKRRIDVFQRNAPSVVYIDIIAERQDVFSPNPVDERIGTGSGFVWDKQGHIVTNYHVVRNSKFAQVALITPRRNSNNKIIPGDNGALSASSTTEDIFLPVRTSSTNKVSSDEYKRTVFKARIIGVDPGKDIAVLKIDAPEEILYPIQVGKSMGLIVGQTALAIGNPFGLDHTLTAGVISGLGREVKSPIGRPITNVIQVRQNLYQ
jgi:S1-C subfamily serine protease